MTDQTKPALLPKLRAPVADERAAFEAQAVTEFTHPFKCPDPTSLDPDGSGDYADADVQLAWTGFKWGRAALASAPVAGEAVAWMKDDGSDAWTDQKKRDAVKYAGAPGVKIAESYNVPLFRHAAPQASAVAGEAVAWMHAEDPARVISALQKATSERDGGAYASSLRPYNIALGRLAAPQASEAVRGEPDATGRTPTDYALEFAEYLARDVEYAVACLNSSQRANEALLDLTEEVATAGAYQAAEDAAAQADEAFTEAITALQSAVFEFRKRRDRAALSAQPGAQKEQSDA